MKGRGGISKKFMKIKQRSKSRKRNDKNNRTNQMQSKPGKQVIVEATAASVTTLAPAPAP